MAIQLNTISDLKEESNTKSEFQRDLKSANGFLKDVNNVLNTLKEITGVDIFSKIKEIADTKKEPTNMAGKIEYEAQKMSNSKPSEVIEKALIIDSKLSREDLMKRIDSLDDDKTIKEWKLELKELDEEVFEEIIRVWINQVVRLE